MTMKILRLESMRRKLARIPETVRKRAQADIMLAGREINVLQRTLAPEEDGTLKGTIRTEPMKAPYVGAFVKAGGPETTKPVRDGLTPDYDYALAQEFGTKDMPANPFFYPAIRAKRSQTKSKIRAGIKRGIREGAK